MALTASKATSKPRIATLTSSKVRDAGVAVSKNNSSDEADCEFEEAPADYMHSSIRL